ncbi:hypothetical protein GmRootV59_50950 [Variovorax sp. V59]|jgi:hypothetical protein|uniref:Lipoprotein n=2 Tax=Variovorax TaxID=34072 RepID=A0AAE4BX56_VARPD|nr:MULTISPECIES: hypothetical protein [Variovorax]MBD9666094.1 hypothetical protein [Variovorax sp. VRV01]MDR6425597.1 hypothetical protein [Variovorax paradoxus]MDR6453160.1 hypothetical protein [Variovorax paradoxus]TWD90615.1 hypothetical protein FB547_101281 [Variovorax beijingensis]
MANNRLLGVVLCALAVLATGCASPKAPPYAPDYAALDQLKASKPSTVAVVKVEPTDPNAPVNRISLRGTRLDSPSGTFAKYLEEALVRDLKEVSAFDAKSRTRLDARILANDVSVGNISTGTGVMEVQIEVTREGVQRLKKTYKADISFESSFAGMVAIPAGQTAYPTLVRALLKKVYTDPQFAAAIGS